MPDSGFFVTRLFGETFFAGKYSLGAPLMFRARC